MSVFAFWRMIIVSFETFVIAFLIAGLVFFMAIWMYYDRRDQTYYDRQRVRHVHHCVKCGTLYTSREGGMPVPCPACAFRNPSLRF